MTKERIVAAFDFDGTISYHDVLIPFLRYAAGPAKTFSKILLELPHMLGVPLGYVSRQQVKEGVLTKIIGGMPAEELSTLGEKFALGPMKELINPKAMEKVRWHQQQGHQCILISANLDIFLAPWSKHERFDNLICSQLAIDQNGNVTGKLVGLNCYGHVKASRLEAWLGARNGYELYAYGDSKGDREMLAMADHPYYRNFE